MNRTSGPLLLVGIVVTAAACTGTAQAQMCPWGMQAQLQVQVQWQSQQQTQMMMQQRMMMQQQTMMQQQMMRQQMMLPMIQMAQSRAMFQQRQAMQVVQQQQMMRSQMLLSHHVQQLHQQQMMARWQAILMRPVGPGHGGHPWWLFQLAAAQRHTVAFRQTQHLVATHQIARVSHLQRLTLARQQAMHRTQLALRQRHLLRQVNQQRMIPRQVRQYQNFQVARTTTHHTPLIQVRVTMNVSCARCHQGGVPTVVRRGGPPDIARLPLIPPRMIARVPPRQPLPLIAQPRLPLLPIAPVPQPMPALVRLPQPPLGFPVQQPLLPADLRAIIQQARPLAPIAAGQPGLAAMVRKPGDPKSPLQRTSSSRTLDRTATRSQAPSAAPPPLAPLDTALSGSVVRLASPPPEAVAPEGPRPRDDGEETVALDALLRSPSLPPLDIDHPLQPLEGKRSLPPTSAAPSLAELVLQPPQLPALP